MTSLIEDSGDDCNDADNLRKLDKHDISISLKLT